jgi:hypothetical protein
LASLLGGLLWDYSGAKTAKGSLAAPLLRHFGFFASRSPKEGPHARTAISGASVKSTSARAASAEFTPRQGFLVCDAHRGSSVIAGVSIVYSTAPFAAHKRIIHLVRQSRDAPANHAANHARPLADLAAVG